MSITRQHLVPSSTLMIVRLKDEKDLSQGYERLLSGNRWVAIEKANIYSALKHHAMVLWNPYTRRRKDKLGLSFGE